ncbi:hypothetical protein N780_15760 [Pontibacillus chungwhensis BH030062]|uniref:DUF3953 domain-containing protein n=1 Tax=Pontibacillus chungwhensis BH030062 TaxID=1385513 RepID=A0A0A2UVP3_9BACI|nr:hypothetical protein N780_15760 [Pontibacillus chungwhensis BH030062]
MLRLLALILSIISVVTVFFSLNIAILILGTSLLLFGFNNLKIKNKSMGYTYLTSGAVFIIGSCIKVFY